jgi:hypothetical protein
VVSLQEGADGLATHFRDALGMLKTIIGDSEAYASDVDAALKSYDLDRDIERHLHALPSPSV